MRTTWTQLVIIDIHLRSKGNMHARKQYNYVQIIAKEVPQIWMWCNVREQWCNKSDNNAESKKQRNVKKTRPGQDTLQLYRSQKANKSKWDPPQLAKLTFASHCNNANTILNRFNVEITAMTEQQLIRLHLNLRTLCHNCDKDVISTNKDALSIWT